MKFTVELDDSFNPPRGSPASFLRFLKVFNLDLKEFLSLVIESIHEL